MAPKEAKRGEERPRPGTRAGESGALGLQDASGGPGEGWGTTGWAGSQRVGRGCVEGGSQAWGWATAFQDSTLRLLPPTKALQMGAT